MRDVGDAGAEARVLMSEAGRALLAEVGTVEVPGPADLVRWRKWASAELVAAALRLAACRRRGVAKFSRADAMWFEATGLEQATAEPVARHKARRFEGGIVVDLCAGIGGDTLALASGAKVLSVDLDAGMNRRTRWNAEVYGVAERVAPIQARAEVFPVPRGAHIHIDPDRRACPGASGRARALRDYVPGLGFLSRLPEMAPGGAIKLGPASDFGTHFYALGLEVELISLGGECKEATVWFGDLATCRRRATRLPDFATWTDRSAPDAPSIVSSGPSRWVFDPDPALVRSGLLDSFATAHGLCRCDQGIDFLTGPDLIASPFLAAFEVQEILPLDLKILKRLVAARGLGPLEIKTKGVDVRPESLRDRLRPPGPNPATLLLMGGAGSSLAVLAKRIKEGSKGQPKAPVRKRG